MKVAKSSTFENTVQVSDECLQPVEHSYYR